MTKLRIAHLAGPTATIQNTPPLVTSNKAREKAGLPPLPGDFDPLRAQRLAAPVKVYVEQFSAHPLEADTAELYAAPDGWLAPDGSFSTTKTSDADKPVYEIELKPEDGLYPLPYMALQADGKPWEEEATYPGSPVARQGFFPDGSRSFEEIDRLSIDANGKVNQIGGRAEVDFYRVAPPGGFTKGLPHDSRADTGDGDTPAERMGHDFFAYKPWHLAKSPPRPTLAKITNDVQAVMSSGKYDGAIWTQGSPQVEETAYWFNLLIDTDLPIACNAAQRPQGQISNDGPANIVDSVTYIQSGIWKDGKGGNRAGTVVIQEQQFFAAREVAKVDARPGGYVATGGHGGILGQVTHMGAPYMMYVPAYKHTVIVRREPDEAPQLRHRHQARRRQGRHLLGARSRTASATSSPTPSRPSRSSRKAATTPTPSATIRPPRTTSTTSSSTSSAASASAASSSKASCPTATSPPNSAARCCARPASWASPSPAPAAATPKASPTPSPTPSPAPTSPPPRRACC